MVLALAAGTKSGSGDYKATPLASSSTWEAGGSSGTFTWSYPLRVPPSAAGPKPDLSISYDSGSVDGRTASTNNQGTVIGEGFDLTSSYVERKYGSCDDDGQTDKFDLCWKYDNASLVLNGKATELVKDDTTGTWRLKNDDASTVTVDTGADNGDDNGEHWTVITGDGTKYVFGLNKLAGAGAADRTNSVWTVPVFGDDAGEPGYADGTTFSGRHKQQAWRWNLDYVEDTHSNAMSYWYTAETNHYDMLGDDNNGTAYTRGGYLNEIRYGQRAGALFSATPAASNKVVFAHAERCIIGDCGSLTDATRNNWPDVPFDAECKANQKCTGNVGPAFYTRKRMTGISTQAWNAAAATPAYESGRLVGTQAGLPRPGRHRRLPRPGPVALRDRAHRQARHGSHPRPGEIPPRVPAEPRRRRQRRHHLPRKAPAPQGHLGNRRRNRCDLHGRRLPGQPGQTQGRHQHPPLLPGLLVPQRGAGTDPRLVPQVPRLDRIHYGPPRWFGSGRAHLHLRGCSLALQRGPAGQGEGTHLVDLARLRKGHAPHRAAHQDPVQDRHRLHAGHARRPCAGRRRQTGQRRPQNRHRGRHQGTDDHRLRPVRRLHPRKRHLQRRPGSRRHVNDPWSKTTATQHKSYADTEAYYVRTGASHARTNVTTSGTPVDRIRSTVTTYDGYGMASTVEDKGDNAVTGDEKCSRTWYARNDTGAGNPGINSLVSRNRTTAKPCSVSDADLNLPANSESAGDVISDTATTYDAATEWTATQKPTKGEVRWTGRATAYGSNDQPTWQKASTMTYDALGRPLTVKDTNDTLTAPNDLHTRQAPGHLPAPRWRTPRPTAPPPRSTSPPAPPSR